MDEYEKEIIETTRELFNLGLKEEMNTGDDDVYGQLKGWIRKEFKKAKNSRREYGIYLKQERTDIKDCSEHFAFYRGVETAYKSVMEILEKLSDNLKKEENKAE